MPSAEMLGEREGGRPLAEGDGKEPCVRKQAQSVFRKTAPTARGWGPEAGKTFGWQWGEGSGTGNIRHISTV